MNRNGNFQRGGVALMLLVILGMVAVISGATILFVNRQFTQTVNQEQEEQAFHVAEAGVNVVIFGLNESVFTTEGLVQLEVLSGQVAGAGTYTLTFSPVGGSRPGQNIRVLSQGRDTTGRFCQALEVVVHRTDEARQQFVVDQWDHLPGCETGGGGDPPTPTPTGGGTPTATPTDSTTPTPSGSSLPNPTPELCTDDGQCASGSCNIPFDPTYPGTCDQGCTNHFECPSGVCLPSGLCGQRCVVNGQCNSNSCDPLTGTCNNSCTNDSQCPSGQGCTNGLCGPFICLPDCQPAGYPLEGICNPSSCLQLVIGVSENPPIGPGDPRPECQGVNSSTCYPVASYKVCCSLPSPTPIITPTPPLDCVECGNGLCEAGENFDNCFDDCASSCGNDICDAGEGVDNCPDDCLGPSSDSIEICPTATPASPSPSSCNVNRFCEPGLGENSANCPSDCFCGDLVCEASEIGSCAECGATPTAEPPTPSPSLTPTPTST